MKGLFFVPPGFVDEPEATAEEFCQRNQIVGVDLVEVAPDYDPSGSTAILAAQVLLNLLGFIFSK